MGTGLLDGPETLELGNGQQLRLLSAFEVLQARAQARELAGEERELALCANACLLAKAVLRDGKQRFQDGEQVLKELSVEQIQGLAEVWAKFNRQVNPGLKLAQSEVDALKKAWSTPGWSGCTGACCEHFQPCPRRTESAR